MRLCGITATWKQMLHILKGDEYEYDSLPQGFDQIQRCRFSFQFLQENSMKNFLGQSFTKIYFQLLGFHWLNSLSFSASPKDNGEYNGNPIKEGTHWTGKLNRRPYAAKNHYEYLGLCIALWWKFLVMVQKSGDHHLLDVQNLLWTRTGDPVF